MSCALYHTFSYIKCNLINTIIVYNLIKSIRACFKPYHLIYFHHIIPLTQGSFYNRIVLPYLELEVVVKNHQQ